MPPRLWLYLRDSLDAHHWLIGALVALIAGVIALVVLALKVLAPLPPGHLILSTGAPGGAYAALGERYRSILARSGVRVILAPSSGAIENLRRLKGVDGQADAGFVQGGLIHEPDSDELSTLGALYYEPLWLFVRTERGIISLADLRERRIAVGIQGSGAQVLALTILEANGFATGDAKLLPIGGEDAVNALSEGKVDAAVLVAGAQAPVIQTLLRQPGVRLMSFHRAEAYTRLFPHLTRLTLPQAAVDLKLDIPPEDVELIAPTANLVIRNDLHPALASLLMQAAAEIHRNPALLERGNEFPAARDHDLPHSTVATRFYRSGPPLLQRYLPFWMAVLVDRLLWALVPLFAVIVPLLRLVPALHAWRMRARVYRWYGELKLIEEQARQGAEARRLQAWLVRLDDIEQLARQRKIPLAYANELYILREHIGLVRNALRKYAAHAAPPTQP